MKDTLLEKLKELPEPYRSQAIENYDPEHGSEGWNNSDKTLSDAIEFGFEWSETPPPQGYEYWGNFHEQLLKEDISPTLTPPEPTYKRTPVVWTEKDGVHSSCVGEVRKVGSVYELKGHLLSSHRESLRRAKEALEYFATKAINQYMEKI